MARVALKVVEAPPFYEKEVELAPADAGEPHSLHSVIHYPQSSRPEVATHFIQRYTEKGDLILDPFCGVGTTALEAAMLGRRAYASDISPLAYRLTRAKLHVADLTDVTLSLQRLNLRRPIDMNLYSEYFAPFYDLNTFREVFNLREYVRSHSDGASRFLELIALSLLHGHSAGYFSVYTFPQLSLSPVEQDELNAKRRQIPDYRAVAPRILRKAASVLRDGTPSVLQRFARESQVQRCDARDLSYISSGEVDYVFTTPPLPFGEDLLPQLWLKLWFSGISASDFTEQLYRGNTLESWKEFMNEVLLELARVVRPGGRAIFELRRIKRGTKSIDLDAILREEIESYLGKYWDVECLILNKEKTEKLKNCLKERSSSKRIKQSRLLVIRRR